MRMHSFDYTRLSQQLWDSETLAMVAQIHEHKGRQELYLRQKPAELARLTEVARRQSTESSNKIEGIVTTSTRMKQLLEEKTTPRNRNEMEIAGYRDVLNTIHENYEYIPFRPNYILQLHRDLLRHTGFSYGGKFKNAQNYICETLPDGKSRILFIPPEPYETPAAIEQLCAGYEEAMRQEMIDPLLLIPQVILDFLCIHPFNDGNGRMSRLLTLLLLYQCGYTVGKYISIEKEIERTKDTYYQVLSEADQGWNEGKNTPTPFVKYLLGLLLACYREFEQRVNLVGRTTKSTAYDVVKAYAEQTLGKFTGAQAVANCPTVGRSAVLAALKQLVDEGTLCRLGSGRSTAYVRNIKK